MNNIVWSDKQQATLAMPYHTFEANEGTPRSGKSTCCVSRYSWYLWNCRDKNHLVLAYNQEQAFKLVMDCDGFGLMYIFNGLFVMKHDDFGDHMELHTNNGIKRIYYKGGGKCDSHKAFTGLSLGSVYYCEINLIHLNAVHESFRRTMASKDRFHIADLNPPAPNDPILEVFETYNAYWQHWTIDDNPIITEERKKEIYNQLKGNTYLYKRDWLGLRTIPKGVIYSMLDTDVHIIDKIPKRFKAYEMFFAGDGGLTDATSISCNVIGYDSERKLTIMIRLFNWYYDKESMAMSTQAKEIVKEFVPYCRNFTKMHESDWFIDPACKALRMELQLLGIDAGKADNNAKDVKGKVKGLKVGIEYLQSAIEDGRFFVYNSPKYGCANFVKEIGMYTTKDNGEPIDGYNHALDEARYANNYFYKNYVL